MDAMASRKGLVLSGVWNGYRLLWKTLGYTLPPGMVLFFISPIVGKYSRISQNILHEGFAFFLLVMLYTLANSASNPNKRSIGEGLFRELRANLRNALGFLLLLAVLALVLAIVQSPHNSLMQAVDSRIVSVVVIVPVFAILWRVFFGEPQVQEMLEKMQRPILSWGTWLPATIAGIPGILVYFSANLLGGALWWQMLSYLGALWAFFAAFAVFHWLLFPDEAKQWQTRIGHKKTGPKAGGD